MKTIIISFLVFSLIDLKAQITFEKTYNYSATVSEMDSGEFVYFLMDVPQKQCRIYTLEHVLTKTINLNVPTDYYLSDIKFVTRKLFNSDDLIEILYTYEKYETSGDSYYVQYGMAVVNENGSQLMSLNNGGWAEIKSVGNKNMLLAYTYIYNVIGYYDVTTNVYQLGGNETFSYSTKTPDYLMVYPNPTEDNIKVNVTNPITFNGGVFNLHKLSGEKVLSYPILTNQNFTIPINHLNSGTYVWSLYDKNKCVQSNKIVIK